MRIFCENLQNSGKFFLTVAYFTGNIDKIGGMGKVRPCDLRHFCSLWVKELERGAVS